LVFQKYTASAQPESPQNRAPPISSLTASGARLFLLCKPSVGLGSDRYMAHSGVLSERAVRQGGSRREIGGTTLTRRPATHNRNSDSCTLAYRSDCIVASICFSVSVSAKAWATASQLKRRRKPIVPTNVNI